MKQYSILVFVGTSLAWGQSTTTTYQRDVNGRRIAVATTSIAANGEKTESALQTINGRPVPREETSERVLRSDGGVTVTERTVRKFDPAGNPSAVERVVIEETKGTGGNKTVKETLYRGDVNGPMVEAQRSTSETHVEGGVVNTEVTVERPSANRSFAVAERRTIVTTGTPQNQKVTETVRRPDQEGRMTVFQRKETDSEVKGGETKKTTSVYETTSSATPVLASQEVATTTHKADGTEITETSLYGAGYNPQIRSTSGRPELQEQQILEKHVGTDGSVTETLSVRLPESAEFGRMGNPRVVAERVCTGKCVPAPEPPAVAEAKPAPAPPATGR